MKSAILAAMAALLLAPAACAAPPAPVMPAPKLIVAIAVDQFSADLFAEYRSHFTGGLKRLSDGIVFPSGYQSHAATETCPGHSTILTGSRPARTGIIANNWINLAAARPDKRIYCAEDETVAGSSADNYTVSPVHLRVPTMGDRLKAADPRSRVVAVSGKDRAAVMMGGHVPDEIWWWGSRGFVSYAGRKAPAIVTRINARIDAGLSAPAPAPALPPFCQSKAAPVSVGGDKRVGMAPAGLEPGDAKGFRTAAGFDAATLDIAAGLLKDMKLGAGPTTDLLAISLSATDYVGHTYGTEGPEMCANLAALDADLDTFLTALSASGVPFAVVLTADHGGHDLPERNRQRAAPDAARVDPVILPTALDEMVARDIGYDGFVIVADAPFGDFYLSKDLPAELRHAAIEAAKKRLLASGQVEAVFTADELRAHPRSTVPVDEWTLADRVAASFDPARSGDFYVALKPHVTPIVDGSSGYVATHGSPWNYDRRVPILFWWPGANGYEQPLPVETVDIMPTLAALVKLPIPAGEIDGRCLDLDAGAGTICP